MAEGKILPYLDVPLQHGSPRILKSMRRPAASADTLERIRQWRSICPEITIRSTFIVGFPGESEEDFNQLLEFLERAQLDRVGCFQYSNVDGARANALDGQIDDELKAERQERFMRLQADISRERLQRKVGAEIQVLVDQVGDGGATGRSSADSPEIDGVVRIEDGRGLKPGEFATVVIHRADEHDLSGRLAS
jgi:ribosomal protein S12 methylthiotransferase